MAIRLLEKREIEVKKAADKKQALDEGLKLTRNIDSLRQIRADEEASLQQFRKTSLEKITKEIADLDKKKSKLDKEVSKLEERKEIALKPLTEHKKELEAREALLAKDLKYHAQEQKELQRVQAEAELSAKILHEEQIRIHSEHEQQLILLAKAEQKEKEASDSLTKALEIKYQAQLDSEKLKRAMEAHALNVENTEKRHLARDKAQDEREQELNRRETLLKDREKMYERGQRP